MQHCLFELVPVLVHHGVQLFDFSMRNKKMSTAGTIKKNPSGGGGGSSPDYWVFILPVVAFQSLAAPACF